MKRLTIRLLAMLSALPAIGTAALAAPDAQWFGTWALVKDPPGVAAKCMLVNSMASGTKQLSTYSDPDGKLRILVIDQGDMIRLPEPGATSRISFDGRTYDDIEVTRAAGIRSVELSRFDADRNRVSFEADLVHAARLQIDVPGLGASFELGDAAPGLEGLRGCEKAAKAQASVAAANEADRLGKALGGMQEAAPALAQYRCSVSNAQLLGEGSSNGLDGDLWTITVAADGTAEVNGTNRPLLPVFKDDGGGGGAITATAYRVADILKVAGPMPLDPGGAAGQANGNGRAKLFALLLGQNFGEQLLGGRQRYLTVSLGDDTLRFLDLTASNQATNVASLDCQRTQ